MWWGREVRPTASLVRIYTSYAGYKAPILFDAGKCGEEVPRSRARREGKPRGKTAVRRWHQQDEASYLTTK